MAGKTDANKKAAPQEKKGGFASVEGYARAVGSIIPFSQRNSWIEGYFRPEGAFEAEKKNASFGNTAVNAFLLGLITDVALAFFFLLILLVGALASGRLPIESIVVFALILAAVPFFTVLSAFIGSLVYFIIAKLLGGKGGFMEQTLGLVLVQGGVTVAMLPLQVLYYAFSVVPCIGQIISMLIALVMLPFGLYFIYSEYRMIKAVHSLSSGRAAAVIIIPILVVMVLMVIAIVIIGVASIAALGAMSAASSVPAAPY